MSFRITSLPARDQLFLPRDLVSSPPPGAPGTAGSPTRAADDSTVIDITPAARQRQSTAQAEAPSEGPSMQFASRVRDLASMDPSKLLATQDAPSAARVLSLLFGDDA